MSALPSVAFRLLGFGEPDDVRALFERDPKAMASLLATNPVIPSGLALPPVVIDAALAVGGQWPEVLAKHCLQSLPGWWGRLVAAGDPRVAAALYGHREFRYRTWSLRAHRQLLAAANPADPRWRAKNGLVRRLLGTDDLFELRAAVVAPFPDLVRHVLATVGSKLERGERLRALLTLHEHGGPAELAEALADEAIRGALEADVAEIGAGALAGPDGVAALRAAVADEEGTRGALARLRAKPERAAAVLAGLDRLDWAVVAAAHRERPLGRDVIEMLADRDDCPVEVAAALCAAHPNPARELLTRVRPAVLSSLLTTMPVQRMPGLLTVVAERALGETLSGADLLRQARPAVTVLVTAQQRRANRKARPAERDGWAEFRAELGELVAEKLGSDVAAWRLLRATLPTFTGTVVELLDTVAEANSASAVNEPWPKPAGIPKLNGNLRMTEDRTAFLALLDVAATETQWTLLSVVDDRTAHDLLVWGTWRDEWLDRAMAGERYRDRLLLSRRTDLPVPAVAALAELDDPRLNAGLVYQTNATREQRDRLVIGRPFGNRDGNALLPINPELRKVLLGTKAWHWLGPMIGCGDPELVPHFFDSVRISGNLQLRMLLGLWERGGRDTVSAVLAQQAFNDTVRKRVAELLADPDQDAALQRLRDAVADAESPRKLARRLRSSGLRSLHRIQAEGFHWDWRFLVADHARKPFGRSVLKLLTEVEGCPEELHAAAQQMWFLDDQQQALARLAEGVPAEEVLADIRFKAGMGWLTHAIDQGDLTMSELLRFGRPALEAVEAVPVGHAVEAELAELVQRLAGNVDGWVLLLRLLPDFDGTVPELIDSAALATQPVG